MTFDGWYTEEGDCVDAEAPLHLTGDTTLSARWTRRSRRARRPRC